jgi:DNA polymerase III delta subunit
LSHPQIFLFTGENAFALFTEYTVWKKRFIEKHGSENFLECQGKTITRDELLDRISVSPFLAGKRIVSLDSIPRFEKEDVALILSTIATDTLLLFCETKPDKRLGFVKALLEQATLKEFALLSPALLASWVKAEMSKEGVSIEPEALTALLSIVGNDQWALHSEIQKLSLGAKNGIITRENVETLSVPSGEQVIWTLTDLLGKCRSLEALAFIRRCFERGEDAYTFWGILLSFIKNIALVHAFIATSSDRNPKTIAEKTGVPFFGVRNLLPLAESLSAKKMQEIVEWMTENDLALKTGGIYYTSSHQEELALLVERLILLLREEE